MPNIDITCRLEWHRGDYWVLFSSYFLSCSGVPHLLGTALIPLCVNTPHHRIPARSLSVCVTWMSTQHRSLIHAGRETFTLLLLHSTFLPQRRQQTSRTTTWTHFQRFLLHLTMILFKNLSCWQWPFMAFISPTSSLIKVVIGTFTLQGPTSRSWPLEVWF